MTEKLSRRSLIKFIENKKYQILEHTADVRAQVFGKTKEELFSNAMKGMTEISQPKIKDDKQIIKNRIMVNSIDLDNLLVDFLSEILYLSQVNKRTYNNIKFLKFSDKGLEGELIGNEVEFFGEDIKAVTYHGLKIEKNKNGLYQVTVLFDI
jgi:SHS2 domain-containing protein